MNKSKLPFLGSIVGTQGILHCPCLLFLLIPVSIAKFLEKIIIVRACMILYLTEKNLPSESHLNSMAAIKIDCAEIIYFIFIALVMLNMAFYLLLHLTAHSKLVPK